MKEFLYYLTPNVSVKLKGYLIASKRTPYQVLQVIKTKELGKMLLLGGDESMVVQFSEKDEKYYHEAVVHPAMALSPSIKNILVIGGADGGVLREVLKHPVGKITLVEIDEDVMSFCKENFSL